MTPHRASWPQRLLNLGRALLPKPVGGSRVVAGRTDAGVYITPEEALKEATVWACIQYLSKAIAQLPWRVGLDLPGGGFQVATGHPADWLIHKRPSPEMGSFTLRQTLMGQALGRGNGYAEIERDNRGAAYALWFIHTDRVRPVRAASTGGLDYDVYNHGSGGYVTIPGEDMLHIRGFGEGPVGLNVIEYAAQSIGWARATQIFGATWFRQGMNPSGVVTTDKNLKPGGLAELRTELKQLYAGPRGERTVILDNGMKFERLSTTPEDSQFIESRQHQVDEICRWFGVPPHKVMSLLHATFSNIEHQSIEVVVDSVAPWAKIWEQEADYKLFGLQNRLGYRTRMDLRGLMRGDAKSRGDFYYRLWQMGVLTADDILIAEDMNPIGGDEGKARFVPVNMQTLERALTAPAPQPSVPATDDPLADPPEDPNSPNASGGLNGRRLQH